MLVLRDTKCHRHIVVRLACQVQGWCTEGAQKQHLVEIWGQLEAARGEAEDQKRQLATAQVSVLTWAKEPVFAPRLLHSPLTALLSASIGIATMCVLHRLACCSTP